MKPSRALARHHRRVSAAVADAAEEGLVSGYFDLPGGAQHVCETRSLRAAQDAWAILLWAPITPADPLRFDLAAGTVSRRVPAEWAGADPAIFGAIYTAPLGLRATR